MYLKDSPCRKRSQATTRDQSAMHTHCIRILTQGITSLALLREKPLVPVAGPNSTRTFRTRGTFGQRACPRKNPEIALQQGSILHCTVCNRFSRLDRLVYGYDQEQKTIRPLFGLSSVLPLISDRPFLLRSSRAPPTPRLPFPLPSRSGHILQKLRGVGN